MHLDDTRISVSLATVELKPARAGTRLIFTEQAAFLDGYNDLAEREEGTRGAGQPGRRAEARAREPDRSWLGMSISSLPVRPSRGETAPWLPGALHPNNLFTLRKE